TRSKRDWSSDVCSSDLITQGTQRAPNRAMLRAVGFGDGDFSKPIVGVANAYSTLTPCNLGLDVLARRAEATLRTLGVMPQLFGKIGRASCRERVERRGV